MKHATAAMLILFIGLAVAYGETVVTTMQAPLHAFGYEIVADIEVKVQRHRDEVVPIPSVCEVRPVVEQGAR